MLMVWPCTQNRNSAIRNEPGMAKPTNSAERMPSATRQTMKTRMMALMMDELRLRTMSKM